MAAKIFLGKYRVSAEEIEAVGRSRGGGRFTYKAEEIDSGKKVVVEIVSLLPLEKGVREQLERDATVATKLDHVNIHPLYDFGVQDDNLVYVSEDLEGTVLEEWVNTHGVMPVGPVLRIASQIVSALGAAGFHQIVHRAIVPRNLVLIPGQTAEGEWPLVKLLHFEGVVPEYAGPVGIAVSKGFSQYASPEQLRYGVVDFRSEIYSLGATMWFLLTGAPPPMGPEGPQAGPMVLESSGIPEKIRRLISKMLSVNPASRPRDALAFYLQLQECLSEAGIRAPVPRAVRVPPDKPPPRMPGMPTGPTISAKLIGLAVVLLSITVLGAVFLPSYLRSRHSALPAPPARAGTAASKSMTSPGPAHAGGPVVMLGPSKTPTPTGPASSLNVSLVSFNPMTGTPGAKDFKVPTLTFRIDAASPIPISEASFYIDSVPFTEGSAQKPPVTLFVHTGILLGPPGTVVDAAHPIERTIWLKSQENLFPNWFLAYNQSENATFHWAIAGQRIRGSIVRPLHKPWSIARPMPEVRKAKPVEPE